MRRPLWRPIALYWRRQRKRPEQRRVGRTAATVWLSRLHLHLHLHLHLRLGGDRTTVIAHASLAHSHHRFRESVRERHRREDVRSSLSRTERAFRRHHSTIVRSSSSFGIHTVGTHSVRPAGSWAHAVRPYRSTSAARPPLPASAGRETLMTLLRASSFATRVFAPVVECAGHAGAMTAEARPLRSTFRTRSVEWLSRIHTRELRTFHRLATAAAASPARRRTREGGTRLRLMSPGRPPELVWRSAPRPASEVAIGTGLSDARSAAMREEPAHASRPALQLKDLDGALLDRLTDDVIRRVERRARIERERRGL